MQIAIDKAYKVGLGMVTINNGRNLGMASYHAMMALEHDMIGLCMTSCPPRVLPTFGAEPRLGTNPIALAAPADKEPPFVFDAAMSTVAGNKLGLARRLGNDLLPGWVGDSDDIPIMDAVEPPMPGFESSAPSHLLPLGSTRELGSHKGYGLAGIVDILGGMLSGGGYGANPGRPNFGHSVAALQHRGVHRRSAVQADDGRVVADAQDYGTGQGPRPCALSRAPGGRGCRGPTGQRHSIHPEVIDWFRDICCELSIPFMLA